MHPSSSLYFHTPFCSPHVFSRIPQHVTAICCYYSSYKFVSHDAIFSPFFIVTIPYKFFSKSLHFLSLLYLAVISVCVHHKTVLRQYAVKAILFKWKERLRKKTIRVKQKLETIN